MYNTSVGKKQVGQVRAGQQGYRSFIMVFKLLNSVRGGVTNQDARQDVTTNIPKGPDPESLARMARLRAEDKQAVDAARQRLNEAYQNFLGQLDKAYKAKNAEQRVRIEAHYAVWAALFEMLKENFKDLWAFLGVVDADVEGWFRISPTGSPLGFMAIGREGYSFAAGIEQNSKRGVPFPKKWLTVSLAHSTGYASGIGDERMIGRVDPVDENLVGLSCCTAKSPDHQEEGALALKNRATAFPLVFTLSSEAHGQHTTQVPVSALEKYTLAEMVQPLILALTHDDLRKATDLLPTSQRLMLK